MMAPIGRNCWTDPCSRWFTDPHIRRATRIPPPPLEPVGEQVAPLPLSRPKRPAPPAGRFLRFPSGATGRTRRWARWSGQPPSSISTARCCAGRPGRSSPRRCKQVGLLGDRNIPGEGLLYRFFEACRREPAGDVATRNGARFARAGPASRRRRPASSRPTCSRRGPALRPAAHRRAPRRRPAGRARDDDALRPGEAAGRRGSASTTSSPRGTARTTTAPTTARSTASSCGARASSRAVAGGPTSTTSTSPTATPTPTASTTCRCCRRSATRSPVNPDPRLLAVAVLRRWPVLHLDVPAGHPEVRARRRAAAGR